MRNQETLEVVRRSPALWRPRWLSSRPFPGLGDTPDEMKAVAGFRASLTIVERREIPPFEQIGRIKWNWFGPGYKLADTKVPGVAAVNDAIAIVRASGLSPC